MAYFTLPNGSVKRVSGSSSSDPSPSSSSSPSPSASSSPSSSKSNGMSKSMKILLWSLLGVAILLIIIFMWIKFYNKSQSNNSNNYQQRNPFMDKLRGSEEDFGRRF